MVGLWFLVAEHLRLGSWDLIKGYTRHYKGEIIAIDPHRIISTSKRVMPQKKKQPKEPAKKIEKSLSYDNQWAGYAIAETTHNFIGYKEKYRLIVQREGEVESQYKYKSFIALSDKPAITLLSETYDKRWCIEDFFNFDGAMGFDRASTFNLNIRYGKMSLALLSQAASCQFRQKLPKPYNRWNAIHLADAIFNKIDGDIRVKNDTIIVTCYNAPNELNLQNHYENLPAKLQADGIDPEVPWLYNFKVDFRFK